MASVQQLLAWDEGFATGVAEIDEQHRSFPAKVVAVGDSLKAGNPATPADLLGFLNQWLVNHVLNTDKRLGAFIVAKRAARTATT